MGIYRCPLGTLVALETESHSGLKQGDQGLTEQPQPNMITALAPPCSCSAPSPMRSGASETLTCPGSLEVLGKTPTPHLVYRVVLSGLSSPVQTTSSTPHPYPAKLAFLLFLKYSHFTSNHRTFALAVLWSGMPFHHISLRLDFSDHFRSLFKCHLL